MPLRRGSGQKAVSQNISTEMDSGAPQKQAVAIALDVKRRSRSPKAPGGERAGADLPHPKVPPIK